MNAVKQDDVGATDGENIVSAKLMYFNLRARGEVLRFLLIHSGLEWEDVLVSVDDWMEGRFDKDSIPSGRTGKKQLPVLIITRGNASSEGEPTENNDLDIMMPESLDIAKWIAARCDPPLLGSTPEANAKAERVFLYSDVGEPRLGLVNPLLNVYPAEESSKQIPGYLEHLPQHLKVLSQAIGCGDNDGPYVCGSELTYADFMVFNILDNLCTLFGEDNILNKNNPSLRAFYDKMYRLPAISKRLWERPLAGSGEVGRPKSIIYTTKVPSHLEFVQTAWKNKMDEQMMFP
jgi:glutathione S-transferase